MVNKDKAAEIVLSVLTSGIDATCGKYNLTSETLNRYMREGKKHFGDFSALAKIVNQFSADEMKALARGASSVKERGESVVNFKGDIYKALVLSDSHCGSSYTNRADIIAALEEGKRENCDALFHAGDVTEGMSARPGAIYELSHVGYKNQREEAVETFKHWDGRPAYIIAGNHDNFYNSKSGAGTDIVEDICERIGAEYLGLGEGDVKINGITVKLFHGEDGACFDASTEICTKDGWKKFSDLRYDDEVATMSKVNHVFEWQKPTDIFVKDYDGDMIYFKSRTIDCMVTPNHGMWTRVSDAVTYRRKKELVRPSKSHIKLNTGWHRMDAGEIYNQYQRQKWQFTKVCDGWHGTTPEYVYVPPRYSKNPGVKVVHLGGVPVEDMAELIAWYVTEGHIRKSTTNIAQHERVNPEKHNQIKDLAIRLGLSYSASPRGINIYSAELAQYLIAECGHMSRSKYLPLWLKDCDTVILNLVISTMVAGDGWIAGGADSYGYRSISPRLLSDFAEIAVKCGYAVSFQPGGETVHIYKIQTMPTVNARPEVVKYKGTIHCCEVPNGLIYVRRNGKTLWTHNSYAISYRMQKIIESFTGGEKPNVLITGHDHKSNMLPSQRNIHGISAGCLQNQTPWMRQKKLAAHKGFWILTMSIGDCEVKWLQGRWYPLYR